MTALTRYHRYADAQRQFSKENLWALFDGDRAALNVAYECVDRHRDKGIAVRIKHADGPDEAISFAELSDWSSRVANWLRRLGVAKGERVAIMLEPSLAFYAALFGTMKSGAVAVPLFTLFGPHALKLRIEDCRPRLLVMGADQPSLARETVPMGMDRVITADDFLDAVAPMPTGFAVDTASDDMAMFQYTSGTTRELPEAVQHRHRSVVTVAVGALYATGVRPGERFMCPSSPAWGHGLAHGTIGPLGLGVSIASYAGRFDPDRLMDALEEFEITNLSAAATHYRMMRQASSASRRRFSIEKLSYTGEPIDSETARWIERTFGRAVCSIYGTTEVGVVLAAYPGADDLPVREGSLGRPVPGLEVAVLDSRGGPCPPNVVGEISVRRRDGWYPTKDLGHVDADGYFFHDGRADDVIITAGWTISAKEVEEVLHEHPAIREAAVIGAPDRLRGQIIKAFVVATGASGPGLGEELQAFVKRRLSAHAYPRRVEFVESLPKTPAGKINRRALRQAEAAPAGPEGAAR